MPFSVSIKPQFPFLLLLGIILVHTSCSSIRNTVLKSGIAYELGVELPDTLLPSSRGDLLHYEWVNNLDADEVRDLFPKKKGVLHDTFIHSGIRLYRLYYSSENQGRPVVLSGMVALPQKTAGRPLQHYQYHHGTMLPLDLPIGPVALDAPSLCDGRRKHSDQKEARILGFLPAANGFFVSMPDYAGYSISKDEEHPYGIASQLGLQSVDMVRAARAFAQQKDIPLSGALYLSGYSEGGYAAVATHRLIEAEHPEWDLRATAALAGPYNFVRFVEYIINTRKTYIMPLYNWAFYTAFEYAAVDLDKKEIWRYKVQNQVDAIAVPSFKPKRIYRRKFRKDFTHNPSNPLRRYASEHLNLHTGWKPKAPIHFFTGTEDAIVPSFNTMDAYEGLKKMGGDVHYYRLEGEGHLSSPQVFVVQMLDVFNGAGR